MTTITEVPEVTMDTKRHIITVQLKNERIKNAISDTAAQRGKSVASYLLGLAANDSELVAKAIIETI